MNWADILTAVSVVIGAVGGFELIKYLLNRKQNGRKARAEADAAESQVITDAKKAMAEAKAAEFENYMKQINFLQEQLKTEQEKHYEQTELMRAKNEKICALTEQVSDAKIEGMKLRCEVEKCPNRKPPTGY